MVVMLPMILLMNQLNFKDPDIILRTRFVYGGVQVLTLLGLSYLYFLISQKNDSKKIHVQPSATGWGTEKPTESVETTVVDYDLSHLKKALSQAVFGMLLVVGIHYQWDYCQPLFFQCALTPMTLYKNPLFKIFVLGEKGEIEKRPFQEESPFSSLFPKPEEPKVEQVEQEESNESTESKEPDQQQLNGPKQKKKKKTKKRRAHR